MKREEKLLTLEDVRRRIKVSKSRIYEDRKTGKLRVLLFGTRTVRVRERDLQRYIQAAE